MTQKKLAFTSNYEEEGWDDIEIPETGLQINNNNDCGLSTTTRDMPEITIHDSSDDDSEEDCYFGNDSNRSTPALPSLSSINKVKEIMINSGVVITNKEEFNGLMITRIGGENNKVIAVGDDWGNDMEIPEDGFANLTITTTNKKNRSRSSTITVTNDEFDSWDVEEEQDVTANSITSPRELIIKRIKDPSKALSKSSTAYSKTLESFDDDFDFSGVDSNALDLSAEALKLRQGSDEGNLSNKDPFGSERLSSRNSSRLSILPSPAPTNGSQSTFESGEEEEDLFDDIQFPEHMDSLTLISCNDDDDFEDGLDIGNESVFDPGQLKNKNIITRPNPAQQKRARRESFTIEFNTSPKNSSRSSTPSISLKANSSPVSSPHTNEAFSKSLTSRTPTMTTAIKNKPKSTFTKSPNNLPKIPQCPKSPKLPVSGLVKKSISLMNNTFERSRTTSSINKPSSKKTTNNNSTSPNKHIKNTSKTNSIPSKNNNKKRHQQNAKSNNIIPNTPNTNANSILEIMRKPKKQQSFGDGTELDGFDDLPINIDRERSYIMSNCIKHDRKNSVSSVSSKTDNSDNLQYHRKHKKNHKGKKPQLIRNLNADKNLKVIGEMVYNPIAQRWDGNDSALKDFDNVLTSPTRPALISNMNNHTTNTKSFQVVGKMIFDPIKMCWNNGSDDDEEEILARFDYDDDDCNSFIPPFQDNDIKKHKRNKPISIRRQSSHHQLGNINPTGDNSNDFQVGSEFDITPGFLAALLASERQHRNEITRWYPDALSKKNDSRFGLRDITLQRSYLYDLRNNRENANNSSSGNNSKVYRNRSGGLFEAAKNLTRHERRHFR